MNPYYSYPCAAPNYAYAYSATPNHYIQMPRGPYAAPAVVPLQPGVTPGQPYYYPQTPPSECMPEHVVRCVTKEGNAEWTYEWRYTYTTPTQNSTAPVPPPKPKPSSASASASSGGNILPRHTCRCSGCQKNKKKKK